MDDQRCSLPEIEPTVKHLSTKKDDGAPPRLASFNTKLDIERRKNKEKDSPKGVYDSATLLKKLH